jgi:type IV fimbrial biogenesis protein FimT
MSGYPKKQTGFTLIELMVTVAIASILVGVAAPSFSTILQGGAISVGANDLASSIRVARSEAIKRASRTVVCKSNNSMAIAASCDNGASWGDGWIVFHDANVNGNRDADEDLLQAHEALKYGFSVTPDIVFADRVSFNAMGSTTTLLGVYASGNLNLSYASESRQISLKSNGRIKINR